MTTHFPRIYLAIDNCFASKRWTRPREWMEVIRGIGLSHVEASADTEADPLYCGEEYLDGWIEEVREAQEQTGVKVANLYSGHGTYATLGLAHTDERVRERMVEHWIKPMIRTAARLGAGLGFYFHAFPDSVLQDPRAFEMQRSELYRLLARIAAYAAGQGGTLLSLEQMYTPHQIPWTIAGTRKLLASVLAAQSSPLYVTIDTGHQTGQSGFVRPDAAAIRTRARALASHRDTPEIWFGPKSAVEFVTQAVSGGEKLSEEELLFVTSTMDRYPYLFADPADGDTDAWLESLGCYSPILHLQQVVGNHSSHLPFTESMNKKGRVEGMHLLRALARSYRREIESGFPERVEAIYLTLEIFSSTAEKNDEILSKLEESVAYWRRFVPEDGMTLDTLVDATDR